MAVATAALNLDAAVLVITPVVLAVVARRGLSHETYSVSTIHLANSASILMPVSNLTNLMVFHEAGLDFGQFTLLMLLPWLGVIAVEWLLVPRLSRRVEVTATPDHPEEAPAARPWPAVVLALSLVGLLVSGPLGVEPLVVIWAGALVLVVVELATREAGPLDLIRAARPLFLIGLVALGGVAWLLGDLGLTSVLADAVPAEDGFLSLLAIAAGAALLANLVNNIPATLLLLPAVAPAGEGALLAMLIGVGVGPNLAYTGSIANLLWRRVMIEEGAAVPWREFTRIGLVTTPVAICVATGLLWVALAI
jgi:arsenical pump membrane protein